MDLIVRRHLSPYRAHVDVYLIWLSKNRLLLTNGGELKGFLLIESFEVSVQLVTSRKGVKLYQRTR